MTKLYITRHGQTHWNLEGRSQGHLDSDLTDLGIQQAKWLGKRLQDIDIDVIFSSSSTRTIQTSENIRGDRDIEIIPSDNLREINMGAWQGLLYDEVKSNYPDDYKNFWYTPHLYKPSIGETFNELIERASKELESIIEEYNGKNVLVVTHGVTLKALVAYFENKTLENFWDGDHMASTCLNILEIEGNKRYFSLKNDIAHYQE